MKVPFEKELKNKLLIKTVGSKSEEMILLRAFRYFDLSNTNLCDKENFVKTVMKIGITGFTEKDLSSVFDEYDTEKEGKINYKDFIGNLYHNPSIMDNPEKLKQNKKKQDYPYAPSESSHREKEKKEIIEEKKINKELTTDEIIEIIRDNIKSKGIRCLIALENNFRSLDEDNSQTVDFPSFKKTSIDFKFDLTEENLQNLFFFFDKEEKGRIDYDEFIRIIRGQMSKSRRELIEKIFESFEPDKEGIVHIDRLNEYFNPEGHPDVIKGIRKPQEIYNEFMETFEGNHNYLNGDEAELGNVDIDEFCDYYDSISMMIEKDKDFENIVTRVWGLVPEQGNEEIEQKEEKSEGEQSSKLKGKKIIKQKPKEESEEKEEKEEISKEEEPKELNDAFITFKNYLKSQGPMHALSLARQFKIIDENGNKTIDFSEFCKGVKNAGLKVPPEALEELFQSFDYDNSGSISYDEFMVKILGEMNERRIAVVKAAFNKIDLDKSGVVELNEVKRWYNTKNNPQVLNGEITEEDLYSRFIETFGNHHNLYSGIRDKRVTWNEFLDYYKFISFVVPDDDLFEAIVIAAWKLENTGDYINSQRNEDLKKIKLLEQNLEEKQENIRNKKNYTSGGIAPFGVDKEPMDYYSKNKLKSNKKKIEEEEPKSESSMEYNNYIKTSNKKGYPYQNQMQTQYQKFSYQAEGEAALNILKDIIYQRGIRGILGMRRCFMIDDEDNNRILTFENFYKYINNFLIPLSRNQAAALFKLFDKKNSGEIIYDNLINEIVGNLNEERKYFVNMAFERISGGKDSTVNVNVMRNKFYAAGHPDVIIGRKSEQEVLAEFLDNVDYHFNLLNQGKNVEDEEISEEDFNEFYRYISAVIDSDGDFKKIVSGVWGLERQKRFSEKRYY